MFCRLYEHAAFLLWFRCCSWPLDSYIVCESPQSKLSWSVHHHAHPCLHPFCYQLFYELHRQAIHRTDHQGTDSLWWYTYSCFWRNRTDFWTAYNYNLSMFIIQICLVTLHYIGIYGSRWVWSHELGWSLSPRFVRHGCYNRRGYIC